MLRQCAQLHFFACATSGELARDIVQPICSLVVIVYREDTTRAWSRHIISIFNSISVEFITNENQTEFRLKSLATKKYLSIRPKNDLRGRSNEIQTTNKGSIDDPQNRTIFTNNKSAFGSSVNVLRYDDYDSYENEKNNETPMRFIQKQVIDPAIDD